MISGKLKEVPNIYMQYYSGYFNADQLYDLEKDSYEQNNLAYNPDYIDILKKMKSRLKKYFKTFNHPFYLENIEFMETEKFKKMAGKTKSIGTNHIKWRYGMQWPPQ